MTPPILTEHNGYYDDLATPVMSQSARSPLGGHYYSPAAQSQPVMSRSARPDLMSTPNGYNSRPTSGMYNVVSTRSPTLLLS